MGPSTIERFSQLYGSVTEVNLPVPRTYQYIPLISLSASMYERYLY